MKRQLWNLMQTLSPHLSSEVVLRRLTRPPRRAPRPWEDAAVAEATPVDTGERHFGWAWGQAGQPRVLLVHGFGGRASQMGVIGQACAKAGLHALAFDGPAHGTSKDRSTDPFEFAEALLLMGREWGPFEAVVGHSFGGGCVLLAALQGLPSKRLVFMAAPSHPRIFIERRGIRSATRARVHAALQRKHGSLERFQDADIARLERPALVLHDEEDRWVPHLEGQRLARLLPKARLEHLRGVGHFGMLRDERTVSMVVDFSVSRPKARRD
ncbi:MAG: alpha/beta fold hydrolase [Myxococcota bacterium]